MIFQCSNNIDYILLNACFLWYSNGFSFLWYIFKDTVDQDIQNCGKKGLFCIFVGQCIVWCNYLIMYIESWNYVDCLWSFICKYIEKSTVVRIILASDAYCLYIYPLSEIFKFLCCVPCKRDEWVKWTKSHILYHYDIQNIAFIALLYIKEHLSH